MSTVDKVKVGDTTYDVSPGATGSLNGYVSNDNGTPPAWTEVDPISTSDTNSGIFGKLTAMVKNVRWLYNKLGTTDFSAAGGGSVTGALSSIQSNLNGKAESSHTHGVGDLPVTSSLSTNSTSYVPTSSAVYSLKSTMDTLSSEIDQVKDEVRANINLNNTYSNTNLGTWSSISDVDSFFRRFNSDSFYSDGDNTLALGNYVTIQDGTYNVEWVIMAFDKEHNRTAADGTIYDNGYGICMVPRIQVTTDKWNTTESTKGGYISSYMHNTVLPGIVSNLKTVLGDHLINRNVLLNSGSSAYTWTTAYATLMSTFQLGGSEATGKCNTGSKYTWGEAYYTLSARKYDSSLTITKSSYHFRDISWSPTIYTMNSLGSYGSGTPDQNRGVRPLIYIR